VAIGLLSGASKAGQRVNASPRLTRRRTDLPCHRCSAMEWP